jgi:hypothetical protein
MSQSVRKSAVPSPILRKLRLLRQRTLSVQIACAVVAAATVLLAAMSVSMLIDWLATLYDSRWRVVLTVASLSAAAVTTIGWLAFAWRRKLGYDRIASDVDAQIPMLQERWTTMTRLGRDANGAQTNHPAMLRRVATEAVGWEPRVEPGQVVSLSTLMRCMIGLTVISAILSLAVVLNSRETLVLIERFWRPSASISATELECLPGNIVVGRGESLTLSAAAEGTPVERAMLLMRRADGEMQTRELIAQGRDTIEFSHRIASVDQPFEYRFRAGDGQSEWYTVGVADRPEIEAVKLTVTPPAYTHRDSTSVEKLPPRLSAMKGSQLAVAIKPKQKVDRVQLRFAGDKSESLTAAADGWYQWTTTLAEGFKFAPLLTESHGLTNRRAPECEVAVYADQPPAVKILAPDDQVAVRPDDTIQITFSATDDTGIGSAELLVYDESSPDSAGAPVATIPVPLGDQQGSRSVQQKVDLNLSEFNAKTGGEISYEIRVREDRGPLTTSAAPAESGNAANQKTSSSTAQTKSNSPTKPSQAAVPKSSAPEPATSATPPTSQIASTDQTPATTAKNTADSQSPSKPSSAGAMTQTAKGEAPNSNDPVKDTNETRTPAAHLQSNGQAAGGAPQNGKASPTATPEGAPPVREATSSRQIVSSKTPKDGSTAPAASNPATEKSVAEKTAPTSSTAANAQSPAKIPEKVPAGSEPQKNATPNKQSPNTTSNNQKSDGQPSKDQTASRQAANKASTQPNNEPGSASTPSPPDSMPRRSLDVAAQTSSSNRMRIKVDEFAGSFSGQQRAKLELAIAPELEALDKLLANAQQTAQGVLDQLKSNTAWRAEFDREVTTAGKATSDAEAVVDKLQKRAKDTPYAFIGLQVSDIGLAYITPARGDFWKALQSDGPERPESVREGWQHVTRARELVAELRGQFERTRREFQLAEAVEKAKKMYQVYVENSHKLLDIQDTDPDRYNRKLVEFNLDEDYLKRLQEVLKMRRDLEAELARILADDPRLLRRFMDSLRHRTENLREELAKLVAEQQTLNREVRAWSMVSDADRPNIANILLQRQVSDVAKIAKSAGELQGRYQAWLPLERQSKDADLAAATKTVQEVASVAGELNSAAQQFIAQPTSPNAATKPAADGDQSKKPEASPTDAAKPLDEMLAKGQQLYQQLTSLQVALRQLSARDAEPETASFAANRLVDTQRLVSDTSAWLRQIRAQKAGNYVGAAEVDQYRLAMKTDELAGKLGSLEQALAAGLERPDGTLPEEIAKKSREFITSLDKQVAPNQLAAVYALHSNQLPRAVAQQKSAGDALASAEKLYDELMRMAIAEMDKLPVQDPIADLLNDPTLDELLAQLEQELPLAEILGIPLRPSNLRIIGDWLQPGSGGGGGGGGRMVATQMRQDQQRTRQKLDRAYQRAIARALKESAPKHDVPVPKPGKLSDWNRLLSHLGDDLRQGRDKAPPEQYRRAIDQYFDEISRIRSEVESKK